MAGNQKELVDAVMASARELGVHPSDVLTAISYETAGTLDPWKKGPTTQWGEHRGLYQWGEPQRQKYGVTPDMSIADQVAAGTRYLRDAGVKPGMGLLDIYSAINAGRVGRYGASDANNGGAPGTVADKVATQMIGHRLRANQLLGITGEGPAIAAATATAPTARPVTVNGQPTMATPLAQSPLAAGTTGSAPAAAAGGNFDLGPLLAMLRSHQAKEDENRAPLKAVQMPDLQRDRRARIIAAALRRIRET